MSWYSFDLYRTKDRHQVKPQQVGYKSSQHQQKKHSYHTDKQQLSDREKKYLGPLESGAGLAILETKFTNISPDNTRMDDMVFQCNNKNAIYVLNANYSSYGDSNHRKFPGHPRRSFPDNCANSPAEVCSQSTAKSNDNFSVSKNLYKFKVFGNLSLDDVKQYTNSSKSSSPAANAIQKLFSCSGSNYSSAAVRNNSNLFWKNNKRNNNYDILINGQMTEMNDSSSRIDHHSDQNRHLPQLGTGSGTLTDRSLAGGISGNKKKCVPVKSALIAKKTKFIKYLEEEKWQNSSTTNYELDRVNNSSKCSSLMSSSSSSNSNANTSKARTPQVTSLPEISENNHENGTMINDRSTKSRKFMNWSGNRNNEGNNSNILEEHKKQQQQQQQQKSSAELYKEAAELLGLSCTLCDNCRCLDCQSRYFEWDDSDSLSEISLKYDQDECEDDDFFADILSTATENHKKHSHQSVLEFENYSDNNFQANEIDHNFNYDNSEDIDDVTDKYLSENVQNINGLSLKEKSE